MLFQNLSNSELENLLIEETKRYTSSLRTAKRTAENEQIRLRIEVLIKALYERKESNERIQEIIKLIESKNNERFSTGNSGPAQI